MNEDYVSLEVAKLLKEKGFDEITTKAYNTMYNCLETHNANYEQIPLGYYLAPTLYMAHKWLREKKGVFIMMDMWKGGYHAVLWKMDETYIKTMAFKGPNNEGVWDTYEEALQAGILETLELI